MKKVFFVLMVIAAVALNTKVFASSNAAILGSWKVEAPTAPWEYSKTTLVITEANDVLSAKLVTEDKQELKVKTITFADNVLKFSLFIDGYNIQIEGKLADSKLTGVADSPEGDIKFTAEKSK
jgi:hypothetical protein